MSVIFPRFGNEVIQIHKISDEIPTPIQDKKFWSSIENNILLRDYLLSHISSEGHLIWRNQEIVCSATIVSGCQSSVSPRIFPDSMHYREIEEASDKIIKHIENAALQSHTNITVRCNDPDLVPVILYFWETYEVHDLEVKFRVISFPSNNILQYHIKFGNIVTGNLVNNSCRNETQKNFSPLSGCSS